MHNSGSKLAIGTANFGLSYGVKNFSGKLSDFKLSQIMQISKEAGVKSFDTAPSYGDSEKRLGSFLNSGSKIITKVGVGLEKKYQTGMLYNSVEKSLKRLKIESLYGLLLHRPELLLSEYGSDIVRELKVLKEKGLIENFGVSIYGPDILGEILKITHLDIVQAPFNVLDRRLICSGWAERLKINGTEIHVRSVFLQGLLLMQPAELPSWFRLNWPKVFDQWFEFQKQVGLSADEISLSHALKQPLVDKVIVGVDNAAQLKRLLQIECAKIADINLELIAQDINLIDPSRWKLN